MQRDSCIPSNTFKGNSCKVGRRRDDGDGRWDRSPSRNRNRIKSRREGLDFDRPRTIGIRRRPNGLRTDDIAGKDDCRNSCRSRGHNFYPFILPYAGSVDTFLNNIL